MLGYLEDTRLLQYYDRGVTLLWMKEELGDLRLKTSCLTEPQTVLNLAEVALEELGRRTRRESVGGWAHKRLESETIVHSSSRRGLNSPEG